MSKRKITTPEKKARLTNDRHVPAGEGSKLNFFEQTQLHKDFCKKFAEQFSLADWWDDLALKQLDGAIGKFNHELMPKCDGLRWRVHDAPVRAGVIGNMLLDSHEQVMESVALLSKVALIWASAVETKNYSKICFEARFGPTRKARSDSEPKI